MKISELPKLSGLRRDIELPLAVQDENYSITLGQIMDSIPQGMVPFDAVEDTTDVEYDNGTPTFTTGTVIFDKVTDKFYYRVIMMIGEPGNFVPTVKYYRQWDTRGKYYDGENIKQDCIYLSADGQLHYFNGTTLKSIGISEEQITQIRHNTPIEVESEEMMQQLIDAGEVEDGQLYYVAE